jgi:serine/threonine-protein kinase
MATIDERRGTIFAGRYRLERKLGGGGMADVWLAEDQELGRKVDQDLHDRYANDTQFVERFRREATHAAGLSHPNVVSIFDRGEAEGSYYIVMVRRGRTLKGSSSRAGRARAGRDLVRPSGARRSPVRAPKRHRPSRHQAAQRARRPRGRVKVADFRIARAGSSQMTEAGSIIGTAQSCLAGAGARRAGR